MKISIIGAGHIGGALAKGLDNKGHEVTIGTRDIANGAVLELVKNGKQISADSLPNAVSRAEVIIIAIPIQAIPIVIPTLGDLKGKIIIETSNVFGKPLPKYGTGAQAIKALSGNMDVAKAFNTVGAEDLEDPDFGSLNADTFVAGDSKTAKDVVTKLAIDMGFEHCYDLGGDDALPLMDSLAAIWAALVYKGHLGRRCALKVLHK